MPVPTPAHSSAPNARRRVLIVEDDGLLNELLVTAFSAHGFEAVPAWDGLQALALLNEERFDLLLTDIRMSMMDGIGLLEILHERHTGLPAMVLSSAANFMGPDQLEKLRRLGAGAILPKPCPLNVLIETAGKLLGLTPGVGAGPVCAGAPAPDARAS